MLSEEQLRAIMERHDAVEQAPVRHADGGGEIDDLPTPEARAAHADRGTLIAEAREARSVIGAEGWDAFLDACAKRTDAAIQARAERAEALLEEAQRQIDALTAQLVEKAQELRRAESKRDYEHVPIAQADEAVAEERRDRRLAETRLAAVGRERDEARAALASAEERLSLMQSGAESLQAMLVLAEERATEAEAALNRAIFIWEEDADNNGAVAAHVRKAQSALKRGYKVQTWTDGTSAVPTHVLGERLRAAEERAAQAERLAEQNHALVSDLAEGERERADRAEERAAAAERRLQHVADLLNCPPADVERTTDIVANAYGRQMETARERDEAFARAAAAEREREALRIQNDMLAQHRAIYTGYDELGLPTCDLLTTAANLYACIREGARQDAAGHVAGLIAEFRAELEYRSAGQARLAGFDLVKAERDAALRDLATAKEALTNLDAKAQTVVAENLRDLAEYEALCDRLAYLLKHTAGGLRGRPGPLEMHGWSDLPKRAAQMRCDLAAARQESERNESGRLAALRERDAICDEMERMKSQHQRALDVREETVQMAVAARDRSEAAAAALRDAIKAAPHTSNCATQKGPPTTYICTRCAKPIRDCAIVGDGNGRGRRFRHESCADRTAWADHDDGLWCPRCGYQSGLHADDCTTRLPPACDCWKAPALALGLNERPAADSAVADSPSFGEVAQAPETSPVEREQLLARCRQALGQSSRAIESTDSKSALMARLICAEADRGDFAAALIELLTARNSP